MVDGVGHEIYIYILSKQINFYITNPGYSNLFGTANLLRGRTMQNKNIFRLLSLILFVTFAFSILTTSAMGGSKTAAGKTLYEPTFGERVYETTFGERVYEPVIGKRVYEPTFGKRGRWLSGKYIPAELENVAYLRCAKLKGFDNLLKCALEALGITQEEVGQAVEEYSKAMEEGNMQWK